MALTIKYVPQHTYTIKLTDLKNGEIYEGSDGLLYVGCCHYDNLGHLIGATGLGHDAIVDDQASDSVFAFREVDAVITIS